MHLYLDLGGGVVIHLARLYLTLLDGFQNRIDECGCGLAERNLTYYERLVVEFLNPCPHLKTASTLSVVVFTHVYTAARGEVGVKLEGAVVQIGYGCITNLAEVMRQDL